MAETQAHYFHATLYSFSGTAVEAVVGSLHSTVNNVAVKCHYDRELDGFELTCPIPVGPEANDALHQAISKYLDDEVEAAQREQRKPTIERFPESIVENPSALAFEDADADELVNVTEAPTGPPDLEKQPNLEPSVFHSVSDEGKDSTLKLFNLRDTCVLMLERTLVHPGRRAQEAVYFAFTCRAARWDPSEMLYAFNGRSGRPIAQSECGSGAETLFTCPFIALAGKSSEARDADDTQNASAAPRSTWEFVGALPSVNQFLEGMGKTVQVDPDTARDPSEVPSDAMKYNAAPEHQVRLFGRSRRPANTGQEFDEDRGVSEDESEVSEDSESSTNESSSEIGDNLILNKLKNSAPRPTEDSSPPVAMPHEQQVAEASSSQPSTTILSNQLSSSLSHYREPGSTAPTIAMPEYNRAYAKVDRNGLTSNAALWAQWEHSNPRPSPHKRNKHGISRRVPSQVQELSPQATSKSSTAMSLSTGPEFRKDGQQTPTPASSFSAIPPLAMLEDYYDFEPEERARANRVQSSAVMTDDLVDVSAPRSREATGRIRPPPGFEQSFRGSQSGPSMSKTPSVAVGGVSQDLVDLTSEQHVRTKPIAMLAWNDQPLKPKVSLPSARCGDDDIVERLQDHTNQVRPIRYTMRQKAAKKKKGKAKNTGAAVPKVNLPKPDPPPPPKPKAKKGPTPVVQRAETSANIQQQLSNADRVLRETHIERVLHQVEHLHGQSDVELQVSFGMLLVRPQQKDASLVNGNWRAFDLQSKLQAAEAAGNLRTDFLERLTTSQSDAIFMTGLLPGSSTKPRIEYEITLRLLQGELRTVTFDQIDRDSFAVYFPVQLAITLYMHYPIHVHDARSRVIRSQHALDVDISKLRSFIASIDTLDDAPPSFRALVPTQTFSVESVHVKRVFAKEVVTGVRLQVTEIQDLKLDPIASDQNFNLRATAAGRAVMVDNHRLWYECSLHLAPLGGVQSSVLQTLVDKMVAEMDGVGYHNRGPYVKTEIEEEVVSVPKFW